MKRVSFISFTYANAHEAAKKLRVPRKDVHYVKTMEDFDSITPKERVVLVNSYARHTPKQEHERNNFIEACNVKEIRLEAVTV